MIFISGFSSNGCSPLIEVTLGKIKIEIARKYAQDWGQNHCLWFGTYFVDAFFPWREGGVYLSVRKNKNAYTESQWNKIIKKN